MESQLKERTHVMYYLESAHGIPTITIRITILNKKGDMSDVD